MGSPIQKRWPKNAEAARRQTIEAAEHCLRLLRDARHDLPSNKLLAEIKIADAMTQLANIRRLMVEAKVGLDEEEA